MHILIIEDDLEIGRILRSFLEDNNYKVSTALDGAEGLLTFGEHIDLVLLDVMLPTIDGFSVLEQLRKKTDTPVIMITALSSEADQLKGFDRGVDDYITKPFSIPILLRKIDLVLRRADKIQKKVITYREMQIDLEGMSVSVNGTDVKLTTKEFEILAELFMHQGRVLTRDVLVTKVWGDETFCDDRIVNIHIKNIRQKLGVDYIETIRGAGYKVEKLF